MLQICENLGCVFFALSDSTRRAILARRSQGSTTIGELAALFNISKHMKIFGNAGPTEGRIALVSIGAR